MKSFADLPSDIERRVAAGERVVCVLLDAFGMRFLERYGDHPFLRRLDVTPLDTQFPSTTTAHVTTMNTGLPVEEHGLYEWNVYEPATRSIVTPLKDAPASLGELPSFYERLGVRCTVSQPSRFSPSGYDRVACRGAEFRPYLELGDALRAAGDEGAPYAYVYFDGIDATGHVCGPASREFEDTVHYALDALEGALAALEGATVLVTADHGQVDVDPARTLWLDELWPPLRTHLRLQAPAGSARDCFLHVRDPETVAGELAAVLGERAEVRLASELFPDAGPRLRARLADVCVLPAPGRMAWLQAYPSRQLEFRGHHGGLTPAESETWVGMMQL